MARGGGGRGRSSRGEEAPGAEEVEDAEEEKDRGDFADAFAVIVVALAIGPGGASSLPGPMTSGTGDA